MEEIEEEPSTAEVDTNIEMKPVAVITEDDDEYCGALDDPELTSPRQKKPTIYQQHSVASRARHGWDRVRRAVDDRAQTKKEVRDKWVNLTRSMSTGVSEFFGTSGANDIDKVKEKWKARSQRLHHNALIGGNKKEPESVEGSQVLSPRMWSFIGASDDQVDITSPAPRWNRKTPQPIDPLSRMQSRQFSRISTASSSRRVLRPQPSRQVQKESVFKMAMDGMKYIALGVTAAPEKKSIVRSRSFAPSVRQTVGAAEEPYLDDVFFDTAAPTSAAIRTKPFFAPGPSMLPHINEKSESEPPAEPYTPSSDGVFDSIDGMPSINYLTQAGSLPGKPGFLEAAEPLVEKREPGEPGKVFAAGMKRMADRFIDATFVNSDRRQYGVGVVGVWLDRDYRQSRIDSGVKAQMEQLDDHRPYFTYWVTFVQIVIFIFMIIAYDVTYFGFQERLVSEEVQRTNLAREQCQYMELENMWLGPRQADLIHLGAKYSPCMRVDTNVQKELADAQVKERATSCCIMNDGSGCYQGTDIECSKTLSTWYKTKNGTTNTVCHQDKSLCAKPSSSLPIWEDDFTKWPICESPINATKTDRHMVCNIAGRPCCIGIHGQCIITTPEHCTFLKGYFHEEAALCSQVHCLNDVCGMIPFLNKAHPDQFYRLWTSLFLHAGLFQLLITVCFQMVVMRDIEKLAGWIRISIIYLMSGIAGSLSSAIFVPYHVEAGPAGSQFGLLACLFVEVIDSWRMLKRPGWAVGKLVILLVFLFGIGLFPWIDNYAHLVGFIVGFQLAFALFPHIHFNLFDERGKKIGIIVCLLACAGFFIGLVILFYVTQLENCEVCKYFNCIPLSDTFCKSMEVKVEFIKV